MRLGPFAIVVAACTPPSAHTTPAPDATAPSAPAPPVDAAPAPTPSGAPTASAAPAPSGASFAVKTTPGMRTTAHPHSETRCIEPLATFCPPGACPTWEAAYAETMKGAGAGYSPEKCSGLGGDLAIGTCGAYRFVEDGDCLSGLTRYFDAKGALVGVYAWGDVKKACGFSTLYGNVPKCP